jgi:hypothetical protein
VQRNPGRLRLALERLEAALIRTGYPIAEGLQPGLSEDEVRTRLAAIGVDPPDDLVTWFGWHDGYETPTGGSYYGWICPAFEILTLEEACERHAYHQQDLLLSTPYRDQQTEWFPVLRSDAASCVINYSDDVESRGSVAICDAGVVEPAPGRRPASLVEPIELWLSYLDSGLWRCEGSQWLVEPTDGSTDHPWGI